MHARWLVLLTSVAACACSAGDGNMRLRVGDEASAAGRGRAGTGTAAQAGAGAASDQHGADASTGVVGGDNPLRVHAEDRAGLTIALVTLNCAGDCADVVAVPSGGNPPYALTWSDGSTQAARQLCADMTTDFGVSVTDTAIADNEFGYDAHTATAAVTANVLDCSSSDAGVPLSLCQMGPSSPFQILSQEPSIDTGSYLQMNGSLDDYRVDDQVSMLTGMAAPSAIVQQATLMIDIGMCQKLLLASDAAGTLPLGWDNELIIEFRRAPGAPVEKRWFYGSSSGTGATQVVYVPTGEVLPHPLEPTVAGLDLNPAVPNPLPFGFEPRAIDLMSQLPAGVQQFELTLYVIDTGGIGSTTDIFAIPE